MVAQRKNPATLIEAVRYFDGETARRYVEAIKWPEGPVCPKCGTTNVGEIKSRNGMKQCREKGCRCQFSLIKGTIFEGTHITLDKWMLAVWQIVNCKNGVSSCEMARSLGIKQQSAWHVLHRVRCVIQQAHEGVLGEFCGVVEADITYVGGLMKWMTEERKERARDSYLHHGKAAVHGLKERKSGQVRAKVLGRETGPKVQEHIRENVAPWARLYTDSARTYDWTDKDFNHDSVNHKIQFAKGTVHTNGIECFWNCLRRGVKGTYVRPTVEHLQSYVDEQVWRFNMRKDTDWERFEKAMKLIVGKRLTYKDLTDGAIR